MFAVTDDRNIAVHRLLDRLGFRREARLVEADRFKGTWSTLQTYAILNREYRSRAAIKYTVERRAPRRPHQSVLHCREAVGISPRSDDFLYITDKESILRWVISGSDAPLRPSVALL